MPESPDTHARIMELTRQARQGDMRARKLLVEMVTVLMRQGFGLGAV